MKTKIPPPRPILQTRPGISYVNEGILGFNIGRVTETYQKLEDGKWVEYNKETNLKTGRIF